MDQTCEPMNRSINQITTLRLPDGTEVAFVDWCDKPLYSTCDLLDGFSDQEIPLFTYTSGDPVSRSSNIATPRISSDRDTNMATPSSNASTEEMLVYAIKPEYNENILSTITDASTGLPVTVNQPQPSARRLAMLHEFLVLVLEVSQKWTVQAGLGYFNTGFGVNAYSPLQYNVAGFVFSAAEALSMRTAAGAGLPSQSSVRSLTVPVHIGGQEKWRLSLMNFDGATVLSGIESLDALANGAVVHEAGVMHSIRIYLDGLYKRPVT